MTNQTAAGGDTAIQEILSGLVRAQGPAILASLANRPADDGERIAKMRDEAAMIASRKAIALSKKLGRGPMLDEVTRGVIAILRDTAEDIRKLPVPPQPEGVKRP